VLDVADADSVARAAVAVRKRRQERLRGTPGAQEMGLDRFHHGTVEVRVRHLLQLPEDGPTGGFFRDGKPVPW
jgi:hypothetical protein